MFGFHVDHLPAPGKRQRNTALTAWNHIPPSLHIGASQADADSITAYPPVLIHVKR
jgi:hypothetical protein